LAIPSTRKRSSANDTQLAALPRRPPTRLPSMARPMRTTRTLSFVGMMITPGVRRDTGGAAAKVGIPRQRVVANRLVPSLFTQGQPAVGMPVVMNPELAGFAGRRVSFDRASPGHTMGTPRAAPSTRQSSRRDGHSRAGLGIRRPVGDTAHSPEGPPGGR
jgi:hypothetical protein